MVQFFQTGPSRKSLMKTMLGQSIGEGLASFTNNYLANKAMDDVINNKELQNAPASERSEALQRALSPYGDTGLGILERRMGIEKQREAEKQEKVAKRKSVVFGKALKGEELTPEEDEMLLPNEKLAIAELKQKREIELAKAAKPKGGATFQSVPPEISQKMAEIDRENPNATAAERETSYRNAGIPPGYYSTSIETRRREEEQKIKTKIGEQKAAVATHNLTKELDADIQEKGKAAERQLQAIETSRAAYKQGKISPFSLSNLFRGVGKIGDKLADMLLSEDEATLLANVPTFIEGMKDIFGVRLSDADLRVVQDKLPSISKSPEANEAIFKIIEKYANKAKNRAEISRDIRRENKGLRPADFDIQLEDRLEQREHPGKTKMRAPTGQTAWVDDNLVDDAIKNGGELYR